MVASPYSRLFLPKYPRLQPKLQPRLFVVMDCIDKIDEALNVSLLDSFTRAFVGCLPLTFRVVIVLKRLFTRPAMILDGVFQDGGRRPSSSIVYRAGLLYLERRKFI